MIKAWSLEHFKSVYDRIQLEMAPLTIFAGANSSGKSTIIQSLLLTTQTLQNPVQSRSVILNAHILKLGTFNDIVSNSHEFNSISIGFELSPGLDDGKVSFSSPNSEFFPSTPSRILSSISNIECNFAFSIKGSKENKEILQLQPRLEECKIRADKNVESKFGINEMTIRRSEIPFDQRLNNLQITKDFLPNLDKSSLDFEVINPTNIRRLHRFLGISSNIKPLGVILQHFLPSKLLIVFDYIEEQGQQLVNAFVLNNAFFYRNSDLLYRNSEIPSRNEILFTNQFKNLVIKVFEEFDNAIEDENYAKKLKVSPTSRKKLKILLKNLNSDFTLETVKSWLGLPELMRREISLNFSQIRTELLRAFKGDRPPEYAVTYLPIIGDIGSAVQYTNDFFSRLVKYLGPLRDEPKAIYPLFGATDSKDVGFKGEYTAAVLEVHKHTPIVYIASENFKDLSPTTNAANTNLIEAVSDWLDYMGVASNLNTSDKGKLGHELKVAVSEGSSLHDLTHVGVGVSQILPILVLSLLADPGSTLIFEQPELHLHPRVQTRLADFFVSMTMLNKQCIVETHSEYLINRLRYQTAIAAGDDLSKNVIIYFVEKEEGQSRYRPVKINKFGGIEEWPKGFFDENEQNASSILRAAMEKRKKETRNQNG